MDRRKRLSLDSRFSLGESLLLTHWFPGVVNDARVWLCTASGTDLLVLAGPARRNVGSKQPDRLRQPL